MFDWRVGHICNQLLARRHDGPPVATNKIEGPLGKEVILRRQFIIILPSYVLNNKNTAVASSGKRVISAWQ